MICAVETLQGKTEVPPDDPGIVSQQILDIANKLKKKYKLLAGVRCSNDLS